MTTGAQNINVNQKESEVVPANEKMQTKIESGAKNAVLACPPRHVLPKLVSVMKTVPLDSAFDGEENEV